MKDAIEWLNEAARIDDLALFLDFDGTLAPIVERPGKARPMAGVAPLVSDLAATIPVAVISGRDVDDVRQRLGVEKIYYSGSHGLEIRDPQGAREASASVRAMLPLLDDVEEQLRRRFGEDPQLEVERKHFGVAVHFRRRPQARGEVEAVLKEIVAAHPELRCGEGKLVREIQPDVDEDKGTALRRLEKRMATGDRRPVFVGDDRTDEDAFAAVAERGRGILVASMPRASAATLRLDGPAGVKEFLAALAQRLGASS